MANRAGAGLCIGVLSGSGHEDQLRETGARLVLDDVAGIPAALDNIWPKLSDNHTDPCNERPISLPQSVFV